MKEKKKGVNSHLTVLLKSTLFLKQSLLNSIKIYCKQEILPKDCRRKESNNYDKDSGIQQRFQAPGCADTPYQGHRADLDEQIFFFQVSIFKLIGLVRTIHGFYQFHHFNQVLLLCKESDVQSTNR